jgi:hypothetical protein
LIQPFSHKSVPMGLRPSCQDEQEAFCVAMQTFIR